MLKSIYAVLKRIVVAILIIYAYNRLALPIDMIIPINVITILLVAFCGIPAILMLVLFSLICI